MPTNNRVILLTVVVVLIVIAAILAFVFYAENNKQDIPTQGLADQLQKPTTPGGLVTSDDGEDRNIIEDLESGLEGGEATIDNAEERLNILDQLDNLDDLDATDDFDDSDIDNF